jgi:hypothetical protein
MSYDFRLFLPQPGVDPLVTAQTEPDQESDEITRPSHCCQSGPKKGDR